MNYTFLNKLDVVVRNCKKFSVCVALLFPTSQYMYFLFCVLVSFFMTLYIDFHQLSLGMG